MPTLTATPLTKKAVRKQIQDLRAKVDQHHVAHLKHHEATKIALQDIEDCMDEATFPGDSNKSDQF